MWHWPFCLGIFFNSLLFVFFNFFYRDFFFYVIVWGLVSLLVGSRIHRFRIFGEFWQLINSFPCPRKDESTKNIPQQNVGNKIRWNRKIIIVDWNKTEICGFPWYFIVNGIPLIHEKKLSRNRNGFCEMDFVKWILWNGFWIRIHLRNWWRWKERKRWGTVFFFQN